MPSLYERFLALRGAVSDGQIVAEPLDGDATLRLGRGADGSPMLLLQRAAKQAATTYGVSLRHLEYSPWLEATVRTGAIARPGSFAVLTCCEHSSDFHRYFFRVVEGLVAEIGHCPTDVAFDQGVRRLVSLFRALTRPGMRSLQGIWAEMLLLANSPDPAGAIGAWHSAANETFDFVRGAERLEVKSAAVGLREHEISLEQLELAPGGQTVIASVLLEEDPHGASLNDLTENLLRRVGDAPELRLRTEKILARCLGDAWRDAQAATFNAKRALSSVRYYLAEDVPSVSRDFPSQVSHVRFRVDLSAAPGCDRSAVVPLGVLYSFLLPEP